MNLVTITNVSKQVVPILVGSIDPSEALDQSNIAASVAVQVPLSPGTKLEIEYSRIDQAQLESLRNKNLLSFVIS